MSVRAMSWVWEHSPTGGNERLVLLAIADTADDNGANAWPSINTLARKTRLAPRTVQRVISRLRDDGQLYVEPSAGRGGSNIYTIITDPPPPAPPAPTPASGGPDPRQSDGGDRTPPPSQPCHPTPDTALSPHPRHSCDTRTSLNVLEPPPPARGDQTPADSPPTAPAGGGGHNADHNDDPGPDDRPGDGSPGRELLAALTPPWTLTRRQITKLAPAAGAALAAGWPAPALRSHLTANPDGVRSPYAVIRARLADLPDPPATGGHHPRPPWCGHCDQTSRLIDLDDGRAARCPDCHPQPNATPTGGAPCPTPTHPTSAPPAANSSPASSKPPPHSAALSHPDPAGPHHPAAPGPTDPPSHHHPTSSSTSAAPPPASPSPPPTPHPSPSATATPSPPPSSD